MQDKYLQEVREEKANRRQCDDYDLPPSSSSSSEAEDTDTENNTKTESEQTFDEKQKQCKANED